MKYILATDDWNLVGRTCTVVTPPDQGSLRVEVAVDEDDTPTRFVNVEDLVPVIEGAAHACSSR